MKEITCSTDRALAERPNPDLPAISGAFDAEGIARAVADDLRGLYGARLRKVLLFGSWARGDAHPESDIDLLIGSIGSSPVGRS